MRIKELMPLLQLHGRTVFDEEKQALFCNWSCSGFSVGLKGSWLKVRVTVMSDQQPGMPGRPFPPADWPCLAVVADGSAELENRMELHEDGWVEIYNGEPGDHQLRIVKPNENARGKLGFVEVETDGELYRLPDVKRKRIEIVGDSITCGFGNEAPVNAFEFKSMEENGWNAYGPRAARELGYEFSVVAESGISAITPEHPLFPMHSMEDIYEYTDELYDKKTGRELQKWDFEKNHNDIVVINLGTNDSNPIRFYRQFEDLEKVENWFRERYYEFIKQVRKANGPDTFICCSLGSMDYYLYHCIRDDVARYKEETGDQKICCFEYVPINMMFEGYGAAGHPSAKTHERMGRELANYIRKYIGE